MYDTKKLITSELEENVAIIKMITKNLLDMIALSADSITNTFKSGGKVFLIGNGGSAADAQHIAAEFVGRFKLERKCLPAIALTTNTSVLTAISNDFGYENVFSRQLCLADNNDILIAITTSGNSSNVLNAVKEAKQRNIKVIGMTGKTGGKLKNIVDILINIPSENIPRIQEAHITIGHILCYLVEKNLFDLS